MVNKNLKDISWNFLSRIIIIAFCILQIIRWRISPQFMDIYYHLLTAWGFIKVGGYSGWDFWQYAPFGRIHIYPPIFHIILALFIKVGISEIILAKIFETLTPIAFLIVVWYFVRKNYNERLAFFVMVIIASSFSFYMGLINYIPSTLAIIFGILALDQLLQKSFLRSILWLTLCFYTHIGISWFFTLSIILYSLFNKQHRKFCLGVFILAIVLSMPILFKQLTVLKVISCIGLNLNERYFCQFKIIEYILAIFGLVTVLKMAKSYLLFLSLFFAAFIFLLYPYRFFSTEGYFPIIFLSALTLNNLYDKLRNKNIYFKKGAILLLSFIFVISPTISTERVLGEGKVRYKVSFLKSAFMGIIFPTDKSCGFFNSIWFPEQYLSTTNFIKRNSENDDIIYSTINILGVCLASISNRATANALFPEIKASEKFNPLSVSKIIIAAKDDNPVWVDSIVSNYSLIKIGENKLFIIYRNPSSHSKLNIKRASVSFVIILFIGLLFTLLFWQARKIEEVIYPLIKKSPPN